MNTFVITLTIALAAGGIIWYVSRQRKQEAFYGYSEVPPTPTYGSGAAAQSYSAKDVAKGLCTVGATGAAAAYGVPVPPQVSGIACNVAVDVGVKTGKAIGSGAKTVAKATVGVVKKLKFW